VRPLVRVAVHRGHSGRDPAGGRAQRRRRPPHRQELHGRPPQLRLGGQEGPARGHRGPVAAGRRRRGAAGRGRGSFLSFIEYNYQILGVL